jgi:hypothetical protein
MIANTLPPATAAIRTRANTPCALPYHRAAALAPGALEASFTDVLAGSATIVVYVDAHGRPVAADIVRATDESFEPAALQLLAGWHYRPAMCGTHPIEGRYTAIFNG